MKKYIYAAVVAMMIFSGCEEYHPFYDGQEFCIQDDMTGVLIEKDGEHIYVPVLYDPDKPYEMECYGGKGKNYTITVSDPECLDYEIEISDVETPPFNWEVIPTRITLLPKKVGDVSLTVKDDDTGESYQINVHVCETYHALELEYDRDALFGGRMLLAFRYGGTDDVLHFCNGHAYSYEVEPFAEGKYSFVTIGGMLYFEMTYQADEEGFPVAEGTETFRRLQVQYGYGYMDSPDVLLMHMNLSGVPVATKETAVVLPEFYSYTFRLVDVTDMEMPLAESVDPFVRDEDGNAVYDDHGHRLRCRDFFRTSSARLVPWKY